MKLENRVKAGFTLYEILITTVLFSLVMVIVSSTLIHGTRIHAQGVDMAKVRNKAAVLLDFIGTEIGEAHEIEAIAIDGSWITILRTDSFKSDVSSTKGGDLAVTYSLYGSDIYRTTMYENTFIADNIAALSFAQETSTPDPFSIRINIVATSNINDPGAKSFSLSTLVSQRSSRPSPLPIFTFGP